LLYSDFILIGEADAKAPAQLEALFKVRMLRQILRKMTPLLMKAYYKIALPAPPNLRGDRDIEHSFIAANIPKGPGRGLDFGCSTTYLALIAARHGYKMIAIDLASVRWFYKHDNTTFVQEDFLKLKLETSRLDLIINCSAIEHVGLTRYGDDEDEDGDLKVMSKMHDVLKPGAKMLLTIPVGQDTIHAPLHRIYGEQRLPELLKGYKIEKKEFWIKDSENLWVTVPEKEALQYQTKAGLYGLGCFVLKISKAVKNKK